MPASLIRPHLIVLFVAACALSASSVCGESMVSVEGECRSAVLLDAATGAVLYALDPDLSLPPASLTKLVNLHVGLEMIEQGVVSRTDLARIPEEAWAVRQPPRSSVLGLAPGQQVSLRDLLLGCAVASGNDAAVALARQFAPSVDAYVEMMNNAVQQMGHSALRFTDVSGLDSESRITARDFAAFCADYIAAHPEALGELHSVRRFAFLQAGPGAVHTNRNTLLWTYPGADGLKTGYIDESGYNLAATANNGSMRLIVVVLGVEGESSQDGDRRRADVAAALLDYGFETYATVSPRLPKPEVVRVWKGRTRAVGLTLQSRPLVTLRRAELSTMGASVIQKWEVVAPVSRGDVLGEVLVFAGPDNSRREIGRFNLVAAQGVERGVFLRRWWDSLRMGLRGIFRPNGQRGGE